MNQAEPEQGSSGRRRPNAAQWTVAGMAIALAGASLWYRSVGAAGLQQSAALFIGLPTILAVLLVLTTRASSATGIAVLGTAVGLLLSGILFGEGFICILMVSPLFFMVVILVGLGLDRERRGRYQALVLLPALLMASSVEGVTDATSFNRGAEVTAVKTVAGTPADVQQALASTPRFDRELPALLRIGFPKVLGAEGAGLNPGDQRMVMVGRHARHFAADEGHLIIEVSEHTPGRVVFTFPHNSTPGAAWVTLREAEVSWTELSPGHTEVSWTIRYDRELDPAWYFGPMQKVAIGKTAEYLIDAAATP